MNAQQIPRRRPAGLMLMLLNCRRRSSSWCSSSACWSASSRPPRRSTSRRVELRAQGRRGGGVLAFAGRGCCVTLVEYLQRTLQSRRRCPACRWHRDANRDVVHRGAFPAGSPLLLWTFLRALALFSALPVLEHAHRAGAVRGLAAFIALAVRRRCPVAVVLRDRCASPWRSRWWWGWRAGLRRIARGVRGGGVRR